MSLKISNVSKDVLEHIFSKNFSNHPELCSSLHSVLVMDDKKACDGLYIIGDHSIGEPSMYGKVYQACCESSGNCEFVAKWQSFIKKTKEEIIKEVCNQMKVATVGLAPMVRELWKCKEGMVIVMDSLDITASRELKFLSMEQLSSVVDKYRQKYIDIIKSLKNPPESLVRFSNLPKVFTSYEEIMKTRREINKLIYPKRLEETTIDIQDTPEEIEKKTKIIDDILNLLKNIYDNFNICHGDTHLNNFMRDSDGVYKLIDFGESKSDCTLQDYTKDLKRVQRDLTKIVEEDGYNNLQYLLEHFNKKILFD